MGELSKMQQQIYDFIRSSLEANGYPPSVREIGEAVGLRSPSTVHFHLKNLEEAGYIEKSAGKGRTLTLTNTTERNQIPVVGNVAAGAPILAQECVEDYITFDVGGREDEYFALRVRGMSMKDAGILPGDLVIVKKQNEGRNGQIVVAMIGEEATVKRYQRLDGQLWLLPENEDYEPIDGSEAQILGRVTAVVRQY